MIIVFVSTIQILIKNINHKNFISNFMSFGIVLKFNNLLSLPICFLNSIQFTSTFELFYTNS